MPFEPACAQALFVGGDDTEMDRTQKEAAVAELSERLSDAEAIFAVDYRGISVTGAAELRAKLAEADAVFKVVKNRLAKLAVADAGTEELDELLSGPTALTLIKGDPVLAAKAIAGFRRQHNVLDYKGGVMDGRPLDADGFQTIARLPALEVLHGQLVGAVGSPLTGLARGLGSMVSGLAVALGQIAEQGLVSGEAPAEEPPSDEAPAEEEPAADEPPSEEPEEAAPEQEAAEASPPGAGGEIESESADEQTEGEPAPEQAEEEPKEE